MSKIRLVHRLSWGLLLLAGMTAAAADSWRGTLRGGGEVQVDPRTHKPVLSYPGGSTQLWDGAHEMSDGSVLIVRDGVAVPDERMYQAWREHYQVPQLAQDDPCVMLMRKTCGLSDECADERACGLAKQLRRMAQQARPSIGQGKLASSTDECQNALADESLFPRCERVAAENTACAKLLRKVCGDNKQCADSEACNLARQLVDMEREERMLSRDPSAPTDIGRQCTEAMSNAFFKACR